MTLKGESQGHADLWIVNVCRVTIAYNLEVIWGYLLAAEFSAVPAVFLVSISFENFNLFISLLKL